jgi:hypothetical protein
MHPGTVPPAEYKGFDPTFGQWAKARRQMASAGKKRAAPASILTVALPADPPSRLEHLRAYAGGRLPLYDRYEAGDHREVWAELVASGAGIRDDPRAPDALAVAYETMRRVEANVRTLVQRLSAIGYVFTPDGAPRGVPRLSGMFDVLVRARDNVLGQPSRAKRSDATARAHVPPGRNAPKAVADFEREFGTLPLSLRAFYEVVGEVNFIGHHATLDPADNRVATDPLLVYGLDEGIVEYDDDDEENEGRPSAVTISPDDLHKANTSGGDAYVMAIPDLRADGELANERHGLFFVEYLRLCFEFGGFPGYEGRHTVPAPLQSLKAGLLAF